MPDRYAHNNNLAWAELTPRAVTADAAAMIYVRLAAVAGPLRIRCGTGWNGGEAGVETAAHGPESVGAFRRAGAGMLLVAMSEGIVNDRRGAL